MLLEFLRAAASDIAILNYAAVQENWRLGLAGITGPVSCYEIDENMVGLISYWTSGKVDTA